MRLQVHTCGRRIGVSHGAERQAGQYEQIREHLLGLTLLWICIRAQLSAILSAFWREHDHDGTYCELLEVRTLS
jgi:hypothetical protein